MPTITAQAQLPVTSSAPVEGTQDRQTTTNEVPPTPEAPKPEDQISPKFAALARKEKALRDEFQKLKVEQEAFKTKQTEYETGYIPRAKLAERAKQDALGILTELGITPDEFTQQLLNSNPQDHVTRKLEAQIKALEDRLNQTVSKADEQQSKAYDQALNQIRNEAKVLIDSNPDFETIKDTNSTEAVVELIRDTFDKDGTLLSVEEAAKEVEEYLLEQGIKMAQFRKVKEKLSQPVETPAPKQIIPEKQPMKTLTNAVSASSKPLGRKERRERAIMAFQGKL